MTTFKDDLYSDCLRRKLDNDHATAFFKSIGERISIRKLEQLRKDEANHDTKRKYRV